jgi:hypothetical protein
MYLFLQLNINLSKFNMILDHYSKDIDLSYLTMNLGVVTLIYSFM